MENPKCPYCGGEMEYHWENNPMNPEGWFYCLKCHSQAPTAKAYGDAYAAAMRRHRAKGEWIDKFNKGKMYMQSFCSVCGKRSGIGGIENNRHKPFCPNCGADMRKEEDDDEPKESR